MRLLSMSSFIPIISLKNTQSMSFCICCNPSSSSSSLSSTPCTQIPTMPTITDTHTHLPPSPSSPPNLRSCFMSLNGTLPSPLPETRKGDVLTVGVHPWYVKDLPPSVLSLPSPAPEKTGVYDVDFKAMVKGEIESREGMSIKEPRSLSDRGKIGGCE